MHTLISRIAKKITRTGYVELADAERLRAYAHKHPMWRCVARAGVAESYDAIMTLAAQAQVEKAA